jgi:hypothetical protein
VTPVGSVSSITTLRAVPSPVLRTWTVQLVAAPASRAAASGVLSSSSTGVRRVADAVSSSV